MTIDALNDDVLREIFGAACESEDTAVTLRLPSRRIYYAIILSHVSSRWRGVALTSPNLWTTFRVYLPVTTETDQMITTFLARSVSAPINVAVQLPEAAQDLRSHSNTPTIASLFARCDRLQLTGSYAEDFDLGYTLRLLDLPSTLALSELTIRGMAIYMVDIADFCSFLQSSRVKNLTLDDVMLRDVDVPLPIGTEPGTELPMLLSFHVSQDAFDDEYRGFDVLAMANNDYRITAPSLHTLDIDTGDIHEPLDVSMFQQTIRHLSLRILGGASMVDVAETICGLHALEELTFAMEAWDTGGQWASDEIPAAWSPPSLTSIDFCDSSDIDKLARFLVAGTTTSVLGAGSLNFVDLSKCEMKAELRDWITARVPTVKHVSDRH